MADSRPDADRENAIAGWATDAFVGAWAFMTFAAVMHFIDVLVRIARGEHDARISKTGTAATSLSLAGLVLRLSTRFQREYALGQTATRLKATIDELERVVRVGAEEAGKRKSGPPRARSEW
jgi:hypothetical protein